LRREAPLVVFACPRRCPKFEVGLAYLQFFEEKILKLTAICLQPLLDVKQYVFGDICVPLSRTSLKYEFDTVDITVKGTVSRYIYGCVLRLLVY
jgi:hypothetical protein